MSDQNPVPGPGGHHNPLPPRQKRHAAASIIMVVIGIILLLPGLCALVFTGAVFGAGGGLIAIWAVCLLIAAGGIALIVHAFR